MIEFDTTQIKKYSGAEISGTGYLAFRDLQKFSQIHNIKTDHVLDLGCGCGRSTGFLKNFCSDVTGIDISIDALNIAKKNHPGSNFYINDKTQQNHGDMQFDTIFSILMIFHLVSIDEIYHEFSKVFNSLKNDGHFIIVNGGKNLYCKNYATVSGVGDVPNKSGDLAKIKLASIDCIITDVFWSEFDLINIAEKVGFTFVGSHYPIGSKEDMQGFKDELQYPPYYYLAFRKK